MPPKRSKLLKDEEPPISFYADLVEEETVKVEYNEKGGLMVTQGTQYDSNRLKTGHWLFSMIVNIILVVCGLLTTFTILRIAFKPIPCSCCNCGNCFSLGLHLLHSLRRLLGI